MFTKEQVEAAKAAAITDGFINPGPATIAFYAFNPSVDAAAVVAALNAIAPVVDANTVNSDLTGLDTEAKQNTTQAQIISTVEKVADVVLPIAKAAL